MAAQHLGSFQPLRRNHELELPCIDNFPKRISFEFCNFLKIILNIHRGSSVSLSPDHYRQPENEIGKIKFFYKKFVNRIFNIQVAICI
jgi:hypothetical protein